MVPVELPTYLASRGLSAAPSVPKAPASEVIPVFTDTLTFSFRAWSKLQVLVDNQPGEISFWGYTPRDPMLVEDIIIRPYFTSHSYTEFVDADNSPEDPDNLDFWVHKMIDEDPNFIAKNCLVWGHTHPSIGANPSGRDHTTHVGLAKSFGASIMFIAAKSGEPAYTARLKIPIKIGGRTMMVSQDLTIKYREADDPLFLENSEGFNAKAWKEEMLANARTFPSAQVYSEYTGSYHYNGGYSRPGYYSPHTPRTESNQTSPALTQAGEEAAKGGGTGEVKGEEGSLRKKLVKVYEGDNYDAYLEWFRDSIDQNTHPSQFDETETAGALYLYSENSDTYKMAKIRYMQGPASFQVKVITELQEMLREDGLDHTTITETICECLPYLPQVTHR